MKKNHTHKIIVACLLLLNVLTVNAQTDQFRVLDGVPHLPVFANTTSVSSPETGMLIYSTADLSPMLYAGSSWIDLCSNSAILSGTGNFQVKNKILYLPVQSSVSSSIITGSIYLNSSSGSVKVYDGSSWLDIPDLSTGSFSPQSGFSSRIKNIQLPVLVNDPAPSGLSVGAIYINSSIKSIKFYDGSSWQTITCNYPPLANSVSITILSSLKEGYGLTGSYSYSDVENDSESGTSFQWYRADDNSGTNRIAISGETTGSYTMSGSDVGKYITYGVTPRAATGTSPGPENFANYVGPVLGNDAPVASNVDFSGTLKNYEILTGSYSYSDTENDLESGTTLKWYRANDPSGTNASVISGATSSSYTLVAADVGKYIAYAVTPAASTGRSPGIEVFSLFKGPVLDNVPPTLVSVTVNGSTLQEGYSLTASYSGYSDADSDPEGTHLYQWYTATDASGTGQTTISGETTLSYTLQATDVGNYISVGIKPVATSGASPGTEVLADYVGPILANQPPVISDLSIPSSLFTKSTVTASYTYSDNENDAEGTHIYNWELATDDLGSGATSVSTSSSYYIQAADAGKYLRLTMTPKAATGNPTGLAAQTAWVGPINSCGDIVSHNGIDYVTVLLTPAGKDASCWFKEEVKGSFSGISYRSSNHLTYYYSAHSIFGTSPTEETPPDYKHETILCPSGWTLPSLNDIESIRNSPSEFNKLTYYVGGIQIWNSYDGYFSGADGSSQYIISSNYGVTVGVDVQINLSVLARYSSAGATMFYDQQAYYFGSFTREKFYPVRCVKK